MPDAIAAALKAGDGEALAAALARKKKPELVKPIAQKVDVSRWDVNAGKALVGAAEWICAQNIEHVRDFLPCLAIGAARAVHGKAADKARGAAVLAMLRPFVEADEWTADLVARSGCHFVRAHKLPEHGKTLRDLVRARKGIEKNPFFVELLKLTA
ncbi:MAG: hypothetical protein ACKV2T_23650 [Kofleriaceae bacterium]